MLPTLPFELLQQITRHFSQKDLHGAILTCKTWCDCLIRPLWALPMLLTLESLNLFLRTLQTPPEETFYLYGRIVREINLSYLPRSSRVYEVTDEIMEMVLCCPRLRSLKLPWCKSISNLAVLSFAANFHFLLEIDFSCISETVTKESLMNLISSNPKLEHLDLFGLKIADDEFIEHLIKICGESINYLDLSTTNIGDQSLHSIARNCVNIRSLFINGTKVTDEGVSAISQSCKRIQKLGFRKCQSLTDESIYSISKNCDEIHTLDLSECNKFGLRAVLELGKSNKKIMVLDISYCSLIYGKSAEVLQHFPSVAIFNRKEVPRTMVLINEESISHKNLDSVQEVPVVGYHRFWRSLNQNSATSSNMATLINNFVPASTETVNDFISDVVEISNGENVTVENNVNLTPSSCDRTGIEFLQSASSISSIPSIRSFSQEQLQSEFDGEMIMRTLSPSTRGVSTEKAYFSIPVTESRSSMNGRNSSEKRDRFVRETEMEELSSMSSTRANSPSVWNRSKAAHSEVLSETGGSDIEEDSSVDNTPTRVSSRQRRKILDAN
ncbi:SCF ubiquitin ligase complex subunit, partial [Nowakowskiella sp. JEL0078]